MVPTGSCDAVPVDPTASPRNRLDMADDTFLVAAPSAVADVVADPAAWTVWWPDLQLTVTRDRGLKGQQWAVTGALRGSLEIWLEPWGDGVVLHWYLRAGPGWSRRRTERERARRARSWKRHVFALKDRLEEGREPGRPRLLRGGAGVKERQGPAEGH
jgi:hypothetical protein